jgi:hypothetical protein
MSPSDLSWLNSYVGTPYVENGRDDDGYDCWGIVVAIYRDRLGVELPDWRWHAPFGPAEKLRAFGESADTAIGVSAHEIETPEPWAIGLLYGERRPHHVGVAIGSGVLHARRYGGTVYEPEARFIAQGGRPRWFRWLRR